MAETKHSVMRSTALVGACTGMSRILGLLREILMAVLFGTHLVKSAFDLAFLNEAIERSAIKRNPFHPFSCFDTATLCGVAFGQTVLARAVAAAGFEWDEDSAHSAAYDAEITADLFCEIVNRFRPVFDSAFPLAHPSDTSQ